MELSRILGGGGGAPVGSLLDFPTSLPDLYVKGSQSFLRTGVTASSSSFPDVPISLVSEFLPILQIQNKDGRDYRDGTLNTPAYSNQTIQDGTRVVSFLTSSAPRRQYMFSSDSGATWIVCNLPDSIVIVGAEFISGLLVVVSSTGRIYNSYDCKNWTYQNTYNYSSGTVAWVKKLGNRLYLMPAAMATNSNKHPVNQVDNSASNFIWYSNDGITFIQSNVGDTRRWVDIALVGTNYVLGHCDHGIALNFKISSNGTSDWTNSGNAYAAATLQPWAQTPSYGSVPGPLLCFHVEGSVILAFCHVCTYSNEYDTYYNGLVYRSNDNGATWSARSSPAWTSQGAIHNSPASIDKLNGSFYIFVHSGNTGFKMAGTDITTNGTFGTSLYSSTNTSFALRACKGFKPLLRSPLSWVWGHEIGSSSRPSGATITAFSTSDTDPLSTNISILARFNSGNNKNIFVRGSSNMQKLISFSGISYRRQATGATNLAISGILGHTDLYDYSDDGGLTWQVKKLPASVWVTAACWDGSFFYFACNNPTVESTALIQNGNTASNAGNVNIYRSADGLTWNLVSTLTTFSAGSNAQYGAGHVMYMTSLPDTNNRLVLLGMASNTILPLNSDDKGLNWYAPNSAISNVDQYGSALSEAYPTDMVSNQSGVAFSFGYLYASATPSRRILYSKDGLYWRYFTTNTSLTPPLSSGLILSNGDMIYCSEENNALWHSLDGGINFSIRSYFPSASPTANRMTLRQDPVTGWLYAAGGNRLYISKDNGYNWVFSYTMNVTFNSENVVWFDVYDGNLTFSNGTDIYRSNKGSYVYNFVNISSGFGSVKYMRVA